VIANVKGLEIVVGILVVDKVDGFQALCVDDIAQQKVVVGEDNRTVQSLKVFI